MKNSHWAHNKAMRDLKKRGDAGTYNIPYTTMPNKSCLVKPEDGKIDYSKLNS